MKVQRIAIATMVALTVGGTAYLGSGTALADTPGANASGGSSGGESLFQQNTGQQGRQNNFCSSPNDVVLQFTGARAKDHCVTIDDSFTKHSEFRGGGADAEGGSNTTSGLVQQNAAQRGLQNNYCANPNSASIILSGGTLETHCKDTNKSTNHKAFVHNGAAKANGGSAAAAELVQQNIAQEGRQNNNCASPNGFFPAPTSSGPESVCANHDASANKHTRTKGKGAAAEGGSGRLLTTDQQNTAQSGRQNNNCSNPNADEGAGDCANKDVSSNAYAFVKGGGAKANGGSASIGQAIQQNTAQEGRQNNNCNNPNGSQGGVSSDCANKDDSKNVKTLVKGRGAEANGGSVTGGQAVGLFEQNFAQEGRQNNNCANANRSVITTNGGEAEGFCGHKDGSVNRKSLFKHGGATADGGSAEVDLVQQNIAQEGRQNNSCNNPNEANIEVTGGRYKVVCGTADHSANVRTTEAYGRAEAEGGSGTTGLFQQNTAQTGRQSNNCGNPNNLTLTVSGSRAKSHCVATDDSRSIASDIR
ncbi:hypothetical protein [Streptomyces sp. NPDC051776]|uniref:hypothetical protein n=1 Tax=Streptomyces sp. NPDC051776 TaxID=3155414 RepID=UPI00343D3FB7